MTTFIDPLTQPKQNSSGRFRIPILLRLLLRFILGSILLYAAIMKWIPGAHELATSMANFRILPAKFIPLFSVGLLGSETILAVFLFLGIWKKEVAWLTCLLFLTFSCAMSSALIRDLKIDCGCYGSQKNPVELKSLFIDDLIPLGLAASLVVLYRRKEIT